MSKLVKKHLISNFGGGVKSDVASIYLGEGFVPDSLNVDFSLVPGAARKRKGYSRVNSSALDSGSAITGIYQDRIWGTWITLVCAGDQVYKWTQPSTFSSIATGLASNKNYYWDFITGVTASDGQCIIMTNGQDVIKKYDGYTWGTLDVSDLGISKFTCSRLATWKDRHFFADTIEGGLLANAWTQQGATTVYKHNTIVETGDVEGVYDGATKLTYNAGAYLTLGSNEYDVHERYLYVNVGGNPGADVTITYHCYERLRWTGVGDAETQTMGDIIDVVTTFGKKIMRIVPLRDLLMIYKEDSIWALYATGDSTSPFGLYCVDQNRGCLAGFSVADVKGEHLFLSQDGICKTDGATAEPLLVSKNVPAWFRYVSPQGWRYCYATSNEYLKQYRLLVPMTTTNEPTNNVREIRYDYENEIWSIHSNDSNIIVSLSYVDTAPTWDVLFRTWDEIGETWDSFTSIGYPMVFSGDYSGYMRMYDSTETDNGSAFVTYLNTKPFALAEEKEDISKYKSLLKCRMMIESFEGSTILLSYSINGGRTFSFVSTLTAESTSEQQYIVSADLLGNCKEMIYRIGSVTETSAWCIYWIETEYVLRSEL